jgi:hypothetical protein
MDSIKDFATYNRKKALSVQHFGSSWPVVVTLDRVLDLDAMRGSIHCLVSTTGKPSFVLWFIRTVEIILQP